MIATTEIAQICRTFRIQMKRVCLRRVLEELAKKPDIKVDFNAFEYKVDDDPWFDSYVTKVVKYKDLPLMFGLYNNPYSIRVSFPKVVVAKKVRSRWDTTMQTFNTLVTTRASSAKDTDDFYEQLQKGYKRWASLKAREVGATRIPLQQPVVVQ